MEQKSIVQKIDEEISLQLSNEEMIKTLAENVFKGLPVANVKRAITEGMLRGFAFKDFLNKNVYAIPYGSTYSLVTSIDYSRKIGQKCGVVGVTEPVYKDNAEGKIETCTVTVKKKVDGHIGEFTATVYFSEYNTGKSLWLSKPRTMIAKVAEMHALRKACPEELSDMYAEEELQKETVQEIAIDMVECGEKIGLCETLEALKNVWKDFSPQERNVAELKNLYLSQKELINSKTPKK